MSDIFLFLLFDIGLGVRRDMVRENEYRAPQAVQPPMGAKYMICNHAKRRKIDLR